MTIDNFNDLLEAARAQALPQRLLFVFTEVTLPDDSTAQQQASFDAGQGGALQPKMCVDKSPDELGSFAALVLELGHGVCRRPVWPGRACAQQCRC
jgi:hypothetical protein